MAMHTCQITALKRVKAGCAALAAACAAFCSAAAPQLAGQAELAAGGALKLKVLAGARGLPAPTPEVRHCTLRSGNEVKNVKWYSAEEIWRERAFAGKWRDRRGNEMTLARVLSLVPEFDRGLAERKEIEEALAALEKDFDAEAEASRAAWKACWDADGAGRFVSLKDAGTFYIGFAFAEPVSDKDAQRLLKAAASSLSAKTAGVSAANTSMKWWSSENDQYVFMTNLDRAKGGKFIADAMKMMTAMRKAYETHVPPEKPVGKCKVRIFKTLADYKEYLEDSGSEDMMFSCGMWSPSREELLVAAEDAKEAQRTMRHEAFHQYLFYATEGRRNALWFNEGFATFFENVKYNPAAKTVSIVDEGNRAKWTDRDPEAVASHIRSLVAMGREEYYAGDINMNYVTGWALMYFLEKGAYVSEKFAPYRKVVPDYLAEIKRGATAAQATARAWAPLASRDVAEDFLEFWRRHRSAARKVRR